jgi:hypothetical protein
MRNIDPRDPAVRTLLHDATVDLRDIAVTVDRASAVVAPSMELLEASHAIHRALIVLSEWCRLGERIGGSRFRVRACASRRRRT